MKKVLISLIVLALLAAIAAFIFIDGLLATGVERGATYAMGVETTLGSADVSLFGGSLALHELKVANPPGFDDSPHFFHMELASTGVNLGSLSSDTVEITHLEIGGVDVQLINDGSRSNYGAIMENLKRLGSGGSAPAGDEPAPAGGGKKVKVDRITIRDVKVTADTPLGKKTVDVPTIEMTDVGGGDEVDVAGLVNEIITAILGEAVDLGQLPDIISGELDKGLAQLEQQATQKVDEAKAKLDDKVQEEADKATEKLKDKLGGLLGGDKDDN